MRWFHPKYATEPGMHEFLSTLMDVPAHANPRVTADATRPTATQDPIQLRAERWPEGPLPTGCYSVIL